MHESDIHNSTHSDLTRTFIQGGTMDDALSERALLGAIVEAALSDAYQQPIRNARNLDGIEAAHFLTSTRVDPFLLLLGIETDDFKKQLRKTSTTLTGDDKVDRGRRALRYYIKEAERLYPMDYGTEEAFTARAALQRAAIRNQVNERETR